MPARRLSEQGSVNPGCFGLLLLLGIVTFIIQSITPLIAALLQSPLFWVAAVLVLVYLAYDLIYLNEIFPNQYFKSAEFLFLKRKISNYVDECNQLNCHIAELKGQQDQIRSSNRGKGSLRDTSAFSYARHGWVGRIEGSKVHQCSRSVISGAQNDPFRYLCKYFNIAPDEESLSQFESMLNDFSAASDGIVFLAAKENDLINSIVDRVNPIIKKRQWMRLQRELGFEEVAFNELEFPTYSFQYASAGGKSSLKFDIQFDVENLEEFVEYLGDRVKFRKSIAGQRALMTQALREKIKQRDSYACQECGISSLTTENLLLEIDHIMPLAKGGITSEENLQTLCWKCNRAKGARVPG